MNQHSFSCPVDPARIHQLKNYYRSQKRWNLVYQIENSYPDLRQRDASTVYKAQGSTFDEVFLDLTDIGSSTQNDQIARMLYVGASRATTRLVLFGKLPNRLFKAAA
jgi:ATP-dependent exoDNAse (exonuclease V) alpha subunit